MKTQMKCQSCILIIMKCYHISIIDEGLEEIHVMTCPTSNDVKLDVLTSGDPNNADYIMMVTICWRRHGDEEGNQVHDDGDSMAKKASTWLWIQSMKKSNHEEAQHSKAFCLTSISALNNDQPH